MLPAVIWPTHCASSQNHGKLLCSSRRPKEQQATHHQNQHMVLQQHSLTPTLAPGQGTSLHRFQMDSSLFTYCELLAKRRSGQSPRPHNEPCATFFPAANTCSSERRGPQAVRFFLGSPARLKTPTRLTQFQHSHPPLALLAVRESVNCNGSFHSPVLLEPTPNFFFADNECNADPVCLSELRNILLH